MNTLNPSRKLAAVRRAGGYLFLLAGFHLSYRHRTMRAVVCALWILTTVSCAYAAASLTLLTWLPGDNFNYNTTGVSGDGSVVVGTSGYDTSGYGYFSRAFRWTAGSGMVGVGGRDSSASGVSADGSVVVGTIASNQALRSEEHTAE